LAFCSPCVSYDFSFRVGGVQAMQFKLTLVATALLFCGTTAVAASTSAAPSNSVTTKQPARPTKDKDAEREQNDNARIDLTKFPANGAGNYAARVPDFEVPDVMGVSHKARQLYRSNGAVIMLTVPNLTQYEKQKRWARWLKKEGYPTSNGPRCILLQDISQQPSYRERVTKMMREKAEEEKHLVMIMDEGGALRKKFGVLENETVILVVDADGKVIHHEADDVEPELESARRVAAQLQRLQEAKTTRAGARPTAKLAPAVVTVK
jgi:hypothetical protein